MEVKWSSKQVLELLSLSSAYFPVNEKVSLLAKTIL